MLVGLIGHPLTASRSPRMMNAAFAECGLEWSYALVPVREGHVEQAVAGLVELGIRGRERHDAAQARRGGSSARRICRRSTR